jgi:taurine dioxygenase
MSAPAQPFTVTPVTANIGAVVEGIQLSGDLGPDTVTWLEEQLLAHKVIFLRGQGLDQTEHEAFGRLLGEPQAHPTVPSADDRFALAIDSHAGQRADRWHADVTFIPNYPKISILRAIEVPAVGGDTLWANEVAAYDALSAPLRQLADGLRAVHTNLYDYAAPRPGSDPEAADAYRRQFQATAWRTEHPLVRVHPQTGERALVLGSFIDHIVGVTRQESELLLELFQSRVERPENLVRWRWAPGDVAIWDNRATQHRVVDDFDDDTRSLTRVTLAGEVPVGVDGRASELLARVGDDIPQPQPVAA